MKCAYCGQRTYDPKTVLGARVKLEPIAVMGGRWKVTDGVARFAGTGSHIGYQLHVCKSSSIVGMFE